jgi:hypothetical protein
MWHSDPNFNVVLLVAVVLGILAAMPVVIALLIARNAQKRREADLMRLAIEKGQPVPNFPVRLSKYGTLKAALVWAAVGLGIVLVMVIENGGQLEGASLGLIPILVGIALAIAWVLEKKEIGDSTQSP